MTDTESVEKATEQITGKSLEFLDNTPQDTSCLLFIDEETQLNITNELSNLIEERKKKQEREMKNLHLRYDNQKKEIEKELEKHNEMFIKLMDEELDNSLFIQFGGEEVDQKTLLIDKLNDLNKNIKDEYEKSSNASYNKIKVLINEMNERLNKELENLELNTLIEYDDDIKEIKLEFNNEELNKEININVRKIKKLQDFKDLLKAEEMIKNFRNSVKDTLTKIKTDALNPTLEKISEQITELENIFDKKSNEIEEKITSFLNKLKEEQTELKRKIREIIENLKEDLQKKLDLVKEVREKAIKEYEEKVDNLSNKLERTILGNIKRLRNELVKNEENKKYDIDELKLKHENDIEYQFIQAHRGLLYKWDDNMNNYHYILSNINGFNSKDKLLLSNGINIKLNEICLKID